MAELKKICIIGSHSWATVIAKIIATNIRYLESFCDTVSIFVRDENVNGKQLSDIINETHENIKYLPGCILPDNVVAVSDAVEAAREAHIIVFAVEQSKIPLICSSLVGKIKPTAAGLCLVRGFYKTDDGNIELFSQLITKHLKIQTSVFVGANLFDEIVSELYCEVTLGCKDKLLAATLRDLIQTDYLRVAIVEDAEAVEVCGSLRGLIACGMGFVDGLKMGRSAKATVMRLGLIEMIKFIDLFYPGSKVSTFFESCGIADLTTSYLAGRNRLIAEKFITSKTSRRNLEYEILGGYILEGPLTAESVNYMLRNRNMEERFPLFSAVHKIYDGELDPECFLDYVLGSPEHINVRLQHLTW